MVAALALAGSWGTEGGGGAVSSGGLTEHRSDEVRYKLINVRRHNGHREAARNTNCGVTACVSYYRELTYMLKGAAPLNALRERGCREAATFAPPTHKIAVFGTRKDT